MLTLSSNPFQMRSSKVLYILHPKETKDPENLRIMQMISSPIHQVAKAGETILTQDRFDEFPVVVLCPSPGNQKDFLSRLIRNGWKDRIKALIDDPRRVLIVLGNSVQLTGSKVLIIPKNQAVFMNDQTKSLAIDVESHGLELTRYRYDYNYHADEKQEFYLRVIKHLSASEPIYLLDPSVVISNDGKVQFGTIYKAQREIRPIKELPTDLSLPAQQSIQEREMLSPIRGANQDKSEQELKAEYEALSKSTIVKR